MAWVTTSEYSTISLCHMWFISSGCTSSVSAHCKNNTLNLQKWLSYQELKPLLNNSSLLTMTGWGKHITIFWGKPKAKRVCFIWTVNQWQNKDSNSEIFASSLEFFPSQTAFPQRTKVHWFTSIFQVFTQKVWNLYTVANKHL